MASSQPPSHPQQSSLSPVVEGYLWIVLAAGVFLARFQVLPSAWIWFLPDVLLFCVLDRWIPPQWSILPRTLFSFVGRPSSFRSTRRQPTSSDDNDEAQQVFVSKCMRATMVPALLHSMVNNNATIPFGGQQQPPPDGHHLSSPWTYWAALVSMLGGSNSQSHPMFISILNGIFFGKVVSGTKIDSLLMIWFSVRFWFVHTVLFHTIQRSSMLYTAFAPAEQGCMCTILSMAIMIFVSDLWRYGNDDDDEYGSIKQPFLPAMSMYARVALSGFLGCCATCTATFTTISQWWMIRLPINVVGPLVVVEYSLQSAGYEGLLYPASLVPRSFQWLAEFLLQQEAECPRYYGLLYWAGILVVTSVPTFYLLSLPEGRRLPVVVTRKWFHMIAVLLFGPVIWKMPQLMALSFAIALCVLMVIETIRRDVPAFQHFYVTFLDTAKDSDDQIIVSHIFLIFGCAAPLWLSLIVADDASAESEASLLLAEFGVLCIGIGDAMGAVVGKWLGRCKWGAGSARTLEGSLAMWLSIMLTGSMVCKTTRELLALTIGTTFVTLLEAVTVHLDNLVLPLAGSTILLLLL